MVGVIWRRMRQAGDGERLGSGPRRRVRLFVARHRRPIGGLLLLVATWAIIRAAAPPPPPTRVVTVAARDLAAGSTLTGADLRTARWPAGAVPPTSLTANEASGQILAGPIGAGEAITTTRLLGPSLLAGQPVGTVVVTIRAADPATLISIRAGDRIDVLGADPVAGATVVAASALVLSTPAAANGTGDDGGWSAGVFGGSGAGSSGALGSSGFSNSPSPSGVLVLAVDRSVATRLAAASATQALTPVLLRAS